MRTRLLLTLCVIICAVSCQGSVSFDRVFLDAVTEGAKLYFSKNPNPDETGFNIIDTEDYYSATDLFKQQYGESASTARFVAALLDFQFYQPRDFSFSNIHQLILVGEHQDARKAFAAYARNRFARFVDSDENVKSSDVDYVIGNITQLFSSIYNLVGDRNFASFINLRLGSSLSFVMDTTGSMGGEIEAAKARVKDIIDATRGTNSAPLNYVLMPFNDPGYGPVTKTEDANQFKLGVDALRADGGGDGPELAMHGILGAAHNSGFRSLLYMFTDAPAKDTDLQNHVIALCLIKRISVNIFLTSNIAKRKRRDLLKGRSLYDNVAEQTGGVVMVVGKSDVTAATEIMKATTVQGLVLLKTVAETEADTISVQVDSFVEYLLVQITGSFNYMSFTSTTKGTLPTPDVLASINGVLLSRITITNGTKSSSGNYTFVFDSSYSNKYGIEIRAESRLGFHAHLSQKKRGKDKYESSRELQANRNTIIDLKIYGDAEKVEFNTFQLISRNEEVLVQKSLKKRSVDEYYIHEPFSLPAQPMFVKIIGLTDDKEVVERVEPFAINPTVSESYIQEIPDKPMKAGDTDEVTALFYNLGDDDDFVVHVSDNKGFVKTDEKEFSLAKGGVKAITLTITVPDDTEHGVLSKALLTATGVKSNYFVFTTFVVSIKDDARRCPSPISPVGGTVLCQGTNEGASCNMTCGEEYVLEGNDLMFCEGETWDLDFGTCRLLGSKTCSVTGGGHYTTFDGFNFGFVGACLYQLLKVNSGYGLEELSVVTENSLLEDAANLTWFKNALVTVYNTTIQIKQKKLVLIDGIQVTLPIILKDGRISIKLDGSDLLLTTDFKFELKYDGAHFFRVSLPASHAGMVSGMCGNYDNDTSNEMLVNGTNHTVSAYFGNALEVPGGVDSECRKGEKGDDEDSCVSDAQRALFSERCAATKSFCFENCTKSDEKVDPIDFKRCLFDMCGTGGDNSALEGTLDSLARTCKESGAKICNWRKEFNFPKACGSHSHYEYDANRCPNTCVDREASKRCIKKPKAEACVCDEGYVQDGTDKCTPISDCGCSRDGRYYKKYDFVTNSDCTERCTCTGGSMECKPISCGKEKECRISRSGKYVCMNKRTDHCAVIGQTSIRTLDGLFYEFAGKCRYTMLESNRSLVDDLTRHIFVSTQFDYIKDTNYSYAKSIHIEASSHKVQLGPGLVFLVEIDGEMQDLTDEGEFLFDDDFGSVKKIGFSIKFETKNGFSIRFDERSMYIRAPSYYMHKVSGLCGHYTGDQTDDFGDLEPEKSDVTALYRISSDTCEEDLTKKPKICSTRESATWTMNHCGQLTRMSPFRRNCPKLASEYKTICLATACSTSGDGNAISKVISALGQHCLADGNDLPCKWEKRYEITYECPENMHYDNCASPCVDSCQYPEASAACESSEHEGRCVCDRDFLFHGGKCVRKSTCGCTLTDGKYVEQNYTTMQPGCVYQETCVGPNDVERTDDPCGELHRCAKLEVGTDSEGESVCVLKEKDYALLFGGPHFKTLDNKYFNFAGECCYLFVGYKYNMKRNKVPGFQVHIANGREGKERISESKTIIIELLRSNSTKNVIKVDGKSSVTIDDIKYSVGSRYKDIFISSRDGTLAIDIDFGLHVLFNGKDWIKIEVPKYLKGETFGMAGNFNDDPEDDLMVDGKVISSEKWGEHWITKSYSAEKCKKSSSTTYKPCRLEDRFKRKSECGILGDSDGPFASCNEKVDPKPYIQSCIYDACVKKESIADGEDSFSSYAVACKNKGIRVGSWRVVVPMPMSCPSNSHYENCTTPCQPTCGMKNDKEECLSAFCDEGCVCDDGYILSNAKCVLESECGCYAKDGVYVEHGASLANDDCTSSCTCLSGKFNCEDTSCSDDQLCDVKDGKRNCYYKNQCHYANGGCSDECVWKDDAISCSCSPGRILLEDGKTCADVSTGGTDNCGTWFNTWKLAFLETRKEYLIELQTFRREAGMIYKWTGWFDRDDPSGEGDEETLERLFHEYPGAVCEKPLAAEAMMADGRKIGSVAADFTVDAEKGLICKNSDQKPTFECPDFKVRFLCLSDE